MSRPEMFAPTSAAPKRALAVLTALAFTLVAGGAAACPVCAQRADGGWLRTVALGGFILMPWIIAAGVGLYIRRGLRSSEDVGSETTL